MAQLDAKSRRNTSSLDATSHQSTAPHGKTRQSSTASHGATHHSTSNLDAITKHDKSRRFTPIHDSTPMQDSPSQYSTAYHNTACQPHARSRLQYITQGTPKQGDSLLDATSQQHRSRHTTTRRHDSPRQTASHNDTTRLDGTTDHHKSDHASTLHDSTPRHGTPRDVIPFLAVIPPASAQS